MSKDKIADYDGTTAGNNTDIGGISIAEGMLPSAVNNSMRELTKQLGAFANGTDPIDALTVTGAATVNGAFTSPGIDDNADATAVIIDSNNVFMTGGKTSASFDNIGFQISPSATAGFTKDGATALYVNRKSSDGTIIEARKDNTTVGSIGIQSSGFYIDGESGHEGIRFANGAITPRENGSDSDGTSDLGASNNRFKDLYLGGNLYIGGTGSANALSDYEEGAWNPQVGGSATYLSQKGIYTKIGNIVTVHFDIEINAIGTGSNTRITNFPFTANSSGTPLYAGCVSYFSGINSSNTFIGMYVIDGTTECNFTGGTANATTISQNGFAIFGNNARVIGSVTYRTA